MTIAFNARSAGRRAADGPSVAERALLADLSGAAERGELSLVYQRQMTPDGLTLVGVESLLRWDCPARGAVEPSHFVPLAERHGLVRSLTRWVIDRAMAETAGLAPLKVGFNVSALEIADPTFADEIEQALFRHGFDPARLEIEITETAILADGAEVLATMDRLHEIGVKIALDDFGVGYSSLNHLRLYPFDRLKIDKAFVNECSAGAQSAALIHAVVGLGKALGMQVTAEGVESESQLAFLDAAGVDAVQGYLFGKPAPVPDIQAYLEAQSVAG